MLGKEFKLLTQIIPDFWWAINVWNYFQPARYVSFDPLQGFTLDPGVIQWEMSWLQLPSSTQWYCGWMRNPAPVDRWFIHVYPIIHRVITFNHPRWCRISSTQWYVVTVWWFGTFFIFHMLGIIIPTFNHQPGRDMFPASDVFRWFQMTFIDTFDVSIGSTRIHPAAWWQLMSG